MDTENRRILLDGATATNLYRKGMPHGVCVEEWVLAHPEAILEVQSAFAAAGSDIIYAPTFSVNRARMARYGHEKDIRDYCSRLVALTRQAAGKARVAGDMSPAGLILEPYGDSTFDELVDVYAEQAAALNDAGVDLFVIETMLSLSETRAAVLACRKFGKPIFVTMTLGQHGELFMGGSPAGALVTLQALGITAFGLNCAFGPSQIAEAIRNLKPFAKIPLIAKPNAGEPNPLIPDHYDISPVMMKEAMKEILDAGASIVGGCCGTTPEHIAELRSLLDSYEPSVSCPEKAGQENDLYLANENELFSLDNERLELSEPISCQYDMADDLLDAEEENFDLLRIDVETPEEAEEFALNEHMAKLPVCFHSNQEKALERALFLYQGRCMADSHSDIPEDMLKAIAARYGAVIY